MISLRSTEMFAVLNVYYCASWDKLTLPNKFTHLNTDGLQNSRVCREHWQVAHMTRAHLPKFVTHSDGPPLAGPTCFLLCLYALRCRFLFGGVNQCNWEHIVSRPGPCHHSPCSSSLFLFLPLTLALFISVELMSELFFPMVQFVWVVVNTVIELGSEQNKPTGTFLKRWSWLRYK